MSTNHSRLDPSVWRPLTTRIKERDGYACVDCGSDEDLSVDHVHPLALFTEEDWASGLAYQDHNLITRCRSCNGRKQARTLVRTDWFNPRWLDRL